MQHLYNILSLLWPLFFLLQASLATNGRSPQHRSFGMAVIRRRIDVHKRLMLLATVALMQQPVSEIGFIPQIPPHFLLIVVVVAIISLRDLHVRGHIHPVNLAGGGALLAIQGLQYWWMGSPLWQSLVDGLPGLISRSPVSSKGSWWKFL